MPSKTETELVSSLDRAYVAKSLKDCKAALQDSLPSAARALLEHDVATASVIQALALKQAFKSPGELIDHNGKPCPALAVWAKYGSFKRTSLLALQKFDAGKPKQSEVSKTLGDLILETTDQ